MQNIPAFLKNKDIVIIVARYNEDVNWTKQFNNVFIYNKGEILEGYDNVISLQNVGREGHTYYTHIYENYDNLADYTIFLQGNPFDHSPNIISDLKKYINEENLNISFEFLSEMIHQCTTSKCQKHKNIPLKEVYEKIFNKFEEISFYFGAGAQFLVSKKQILKHSKDFYLNIINVLGYSANPIEGFCVERFHSLIFDYSLQQMPCI